MTPKFVQLPSIETNNRFKSRYFRVSIFNPNCEQPRSNKETFSLRNPVITFNQYAPKMQRSLDGLDAGWSGGLMGFVQNGLSLIFIYNMHILTTEMRWFQMRFLFLKQLNEKLWSILISKFKANNCPYEKHQKIIIVTEGVSP